MSLKSLDAKAVLELVGVLAVVISLIFVAMELNENSRATRSAIAAETISSVSEWYLATAEDEELAELFRQFIVDPRPLTREQRYRAVLHFHAYMVVAQNSFYLEEEGTLDPRIRRSVTEPINAIGENSGVHYYWEQRKPIFVNENFKAFVEETIAAEGTHSSDLYAPDDD